MHALANPTRFLRIARPATMWLLLVGLVLAVGGMLAGLFLTPPDYLQGETVRIIYIHVPSAWLGMAGWLGIAAAAVSHPQCRPMTSCMSSIREPELCSPITFCANRDACSAAVHAPSDWRTGMMSLSRVLGSPTTVS